MIGLESVSVELIAHLSLASEVFCFIVGLGLMVVSVLAMFNVTDENDWHAKDLPASCADSVVHFLSFSAT